MYMCVCACGYCLNGQRGNIGVHDAYREMECAREAEREKEKGGRERGREREREKEREREW